MKLHSSPPSSPPPGSAFSKEWHGRSLLSESVRDLERFSGQTKGVEFLLSDHCRGRLPGH